MPDRDETNEQETRTRVGIGNTEFDRETSSRGTEGGSYGTSSHRDRDYGSDYPGGPGRDRGYGDDDRYDDDDDYRDRARRTARDVGDNVRDAGRSVRRESTDLISSYCDWLGGVFIGIGEAISPRRRGGRSSGGGGGCFDQAGSACRGANAGGDEDRHDRYDRYDRDEPYDRGGGYRTSGRDRDRPKKSRTEIRYTSAR